MAAEPRALLTHEEYFALEEATGERYEYVAGRVYAVGSDRTQGLVDSVTTSGLIGTNISAALTMRLRSKPYFVFGGDVRVAIPQFDCYTSPRVSVVSGASRLDEAWRGLVNPAVIIEILPPRDGKFNEGLRLLRYQQLPSLCHYVLIDQATPFLRAYSRDEQGLWIWSAAEGLDATLALSAIGCQLPLAEVYDKVDFARAAE